jgi:CHAT domain-containing protein/Flp pilus assembly protein TadD
VCIGCQPKTKETTDQIYGQIEREFLSGELSKARTHAEETYRRLEANQPDLAVPFRIELAKILIYQGKSSDALPLLESPIRGHSNIEFEVRRKVFLSILQARLGHLDQAEQTVLDAERECMPNIPLCAEVSGAKGTIDIERGDLDDAQRQFQASLSGARHSNERFLQTQALLNLGHVALLEEHYEDALARFDDTSSLARSIGAKLELEKATGNIGWAYYQIGDFQRSLMGSKEAERQAYDLGSPSDQVHWLNNSGMSEYRLGNVAAARALYEQTLALARSIPNQEEILDAHVNLGFLLLRSGNPAAAEVHAREAIRLAGHSKDATQELEPRLLNALLLDAKNDKQDAIESLLDLEARTSGVPSLQWKAESNLARIYSETGRPSEADHWFLRSIETFQRQRSSLTSVDSTLPFLENAADLYISYTKHLISEHRPDEALNVIDKSRAESLMDGLHLSRPEQKRQSSQILNGRSIAARLQATILVYSLRPKTSYLWVITPTRQQFYEIAGSEVILPQIQLNTKMILASRDLLSQPDGPGRSLYDELVKPAEDLIKKAGRVFIVGDDALNSLNFETLQTPGEGSHYWIEDVTITNAKSLQLLSMRAMKEPRFADKRILVMGDPVYRKGEYTELPNAATEIKDVASHFSSDHRTVFTGALASPEAYQLSNASQYSYIHFVAHGTANMTVPLDSAVVLSSSHGDATVYKLYARDILKQNLHADLVTVSACNGSGVRNYSGEGLVGLAWAFLRAGSHHVIGAMWEVSDISTPMLMDHLYSELARSRPPDAALRSAKLSMIHSDGVFRKPLYWAAFQLYSGA